MLKVRKINEGYYAKFWKKYPNGTVEIDQLELIEFLQSKGYVKAIMNDGFLFAKLENNIISEHKGSYEMADIIRKHLNVNNEREVLKTFAKKIAPLLSNKKLELLQSVEYIIDRDPKGASWFFYNNTACKVFQNKIELVKYENLPFTIWKTRIVKRDFKQSIGMHSDFHKFLLNLAGGDTKRLLALQTNLGYLLHRNQDPNNRRAVIFVDENILTKSGANGGTGKSLLVKAISQVREVETIDGKKVDLTSKFKHQDIKRSTELIQYEDVEKNFKFVLLNNTISSELKVEEKGKTPFTILESDTPKVVVNSNYYVKGDGGSTDARRRCDFEVANHYDEHYQPMDDFGKLFFDDWDESEWNSFDALMMECVQLYLASGLIIADPINLQYNKLTQATSNDFEEYMRKKMVTNQWIDKRNFYQKFKKSYPKHNELSSHAFTKWLKFYASTYNLNYNGKNAGGKLSFFLESAVQP